MNAVPLHIQRKFERRWAARFVAPATSAAPKANPLKDALNTLLRPVEAKEKPAGPGKRAKESL